MNLILIYGPPAAGKLTVAKELVELTGYTLLDNHKAIDYLTYLFPRSNPEFDDMRAKLGKKIRLMLFEAAAENGVNLITTFAPISEGRHDFVRDIQQVIEHAGGTVHLVQLIPSREVLSQRVVGESRKGIKADTVERLNELIKEKPAMFETFPDNEHLVVDNSTMQPKEVAQLIIDHYKVTANNA